MGIASMGTLAIGLGMGWTVLFQAAAKGPETPEEARVSIARVLEETRPAAPARAEVDLAICLDTSGSMEGLIEAAKQKLWAIVNDFALARPMPRLRVALLSFGNDGHTPENGWVEVLTPFTEDLDLVSQRLFALSTNGGTELVGRVVRAAATGLEWSATPGALKVMVVAGNESANQDAVVPFRDACSQAIARDILVNAIYCGDPNDGLAPEWREVARLADGQFAAIDHREGTVVITTPFDAELAELSGLVNATYIPLGAVGMEACSNQWAQDANASSLNYEAAATRAQLKANGLYVCNWDLVTGYLEKRIDLAEVKEEDLPEAMRSMSLEERRRHVDEKAAERARIEKRIQELGTQRQAFVEDELKKQANDPSRSFDFALRNAIRAQAEARGMRFDAAAAGAAAAPPAPAPASAPAPPFAPAAPAPVPGDC